MGRDGAKMSIMTFIEVDIRHRTASNVNVVLDDLHLNFHGQTFHVDMLTCIGLEMQTLISSSDSKWGSCLGMASIALHQTLTYIFKVTNFEM